VADRCGFCGGANGPFTPVRGLFTVLMCSACLAKRARGRGPYPELTDAELRAGLDLLPSWALAQKAAANRQVIAVMQQRLERGELVVPMYGPLGLVFLQRQAEFAEQLLAARQAGHSQAPSQD
jgi:hypothetical protein